MQMPLSFLCYDVEEVLKNIRKVESYPYYDLSDKISWDNVKVATKSERG